MMPCLWRQTDSLPEEEEKAEHQERSGRSRDISAANPFTKRFGESSRRYLTRKMRYCSGGMRENSQGKEPHLLE